MLILHQNPVWLLQRCIHLRLSTLLPATSPNLLNTSLFLAGRPLKQYTSTIPCRWRRLWTLQFVIVHEPNKRTKVQRKTLSKTLHFYWSGQEWTKVKWRINTSAKIHNLTIKRCVNLGWLFLSQSTTNPSTRIELIFLFRYTKICIRNGYDWVKLWDFPVYLCMIML